MLNSHRLSAKAESTHHLDSRTSGLIEVMTDDERRLVAELAEVMRPSGLSNRIAAEVPSVTRYGSPEPSADFAWQPEGEDQQQTGAIESDDELTEGVVSPSTLQWLTKAKRQRRKAKARSAAAWAITLFIGAAIIAGAAYILTGQALDLPALVSAAMSTLL